MARRKTVTVTEAVHITQLQPDTPEYDAAFDAMFGYHETSEYREAVNTMKRLLPAIGCSDAAAVLAELDERPDLYSDGTQLSLISLLVAVVLPHEGEIDFVAFVAAIKGLYGAVCPGYLYAVDGEIARLRQEQETDARFTLGYTFCQSCSKTKPAMVWKQGQFS